MLIQRKQPDMWGRRMNGKYNLLVVSLSMSLFNPFMPRIKRKSNSTGMEAPLKDFFQKYIKEFCVDIKIFVIFHKNLEE